MFFPPKLNHFPNEWETIHGNREMCRDAGKMVEEIQLSPRRNRNYFALGIAFGAWALAIFMLIPSPLRAQSAVPKFEVDPSWPRPLPERWVTGEIGGLCVDSRDHVFLVQRVNDVGGMDGHLEGLTGDELNAGQAGPPVIELDADGNVV